MTVEIKAVNDAPKIILIKPQTILEDASLAITLDMLSASGTTPKHSNKPLWIAERRTLIR